MSPDPCVQCLRRHGSGVGERGAEGWGPDPEETTPPQSYRGLWLRSPGTGSECLSPFSRIIPFELLGEEEKKKKKATASEPCLTTPKEFFPGIGRKLTHI